MNRLKAKQRYILLLVVPFVVVAALASWLTLYSYQKSVSTMRRDVENGSIRLAEITAGSIGTLVGQVRTSATNLALQTSKIRIGKSIAMSLQKSTIDEMIHLQLNAESMLNSVVKYGYVFIFDENRAIAQSGITYQASDLYNRYFRLDSASYEEFVAHFSSTHYSGELIADTPVGYLDGDYNTWMLAQSIPPNPFETAKGIIFFTLDQSTLRAKLAAALADENAQCLIVDPDGAYLAAHDGVGPWTQEATQSLAGQTSGMDKGIHYIKDGTGDEMLVAIAEEKGFRLVFAQSVSSAMQSVRSFNTLMIVLLGGFALLALVIILFFTQRNVTSVQDLLDSVSTQAHDSNERDIFAYIQSAVESMQRQNALLVSRTDKQNELLRSMFLRRLLRGELQYPSDILREQQAVGLSLSAAFYIVCLIALPQDDISAQDQQAVFGAMYTEFGENALYAEMGKRRMAYVIQTEDADLRESMESVLESLAGRVAVSICVSDAVTKPEEIARAWRQARIAAENAPPGGEARLHWYGAIYQDDVLYNYDYSLYTEKKLINIIAAGNVEEIERTLDDLYANNGVGDNRSPRMLRFFAYDLYRLAMHISIAQRVEGDSAPTGELQTLLDDVTGDTSQFDRFFATIRDLCLRIGERNRGARHSNNHSLKEDILDYIGANFTDAEMNVNSIAQTFSISEKYLSQFFREQTNEKLSAYIEALRIDHACRLMRDTALSINEVAFQSGYAHTHTFRAAFKKVNGITPTEYRSAGARDHQDTE